MNINPWTARFTDVEIEAAYAAEHSVQNRRRLRYLLWGVIGIAPFNIAEELWQSIVHGADITAILGLRLIILIIGIGLIFYFERIATLAQTPAIATVFVILAAVAQSLLLAKHPRHELIGPITIIGGVMLIYFYLPVDLQHRTGLALLTSLLLWVSWSFWRNPPPPISGVFRTALWIVLIHLVGFTAARARQIEQRLLFAHARQLETALANEQEARNQQVRFAQLISHEFRNPLAIIKSQAQVAQREAIAYPDNPAAGTLLRRQQIIERAVARLETLFQQWLEDDRLASDELRLHCGWFPIGTWLTEIAQSFALQAQRPLALDIPEDVGEMSLYADETLVSSALLNVLDNAHKYSPPKSPIGITAVLENGQLGIRVSDVGVGIAAEDLVRIFEKSVRLNPEGGTRGMGLGLYLVRRIATAHGGRIEVSSVLDQGSVFTLWLPLSS